LELFTVRGDSADDYLGFSVSGGNDVNEDGRSDFIVGAPYANPNGLTDAGRVGVYSGLNGDLIHSFLGNTAGEFLGISVAGAGDGNGDGYPDILAGAFGADINDSVDAGSAYLFSGREGTLLFRLDGSTGFDIMGSSVSGAGDVNGDGNTDIIASAPFANSGRGEVFVYGLVATGAVDEKNIHPLRFELSQNYPNPFNPSTTIQYYLPKREKVILEIFNLLGERVRVLADGEQTAGEHTVTWGGKDKSGENLPSGIYFYRLKGRDFSETKKMLLLK
jgi:hypothetical protein